MLHPFSPRGLPPLCGREHVAVAAEHFRSLQVAIDFQPHSSSERVGPKLTRGAESLVAAHFVDAKQIANVSGLAVPVFTMEGGGHEGRDRRTPV